MATAIMSRKGILIHGVEIPANVIKSFQKAGPYTYEKIKTIELNYGKFYIRLFIYPSVNPEDIQGNKYIVSDIQIVFEAVEINPVPFLDELKAKQTDIKIIGGG